MHTSNRVTAAFCVALASLLLTAQTLAADKVFDKKFSVTPGGTLTVDTDVGTIQVTGADVHEITVHATMSGSDSQVKDFEFSGEADSHGVTVHGQRHGGWLDLSWLFSGGTRVKFEIQVPHEYHLELRTAGGAIEAQNLKGNVHGHTSGGHVKLNSINGDVDVSTSGGRLEAEKIMGKAHLHTSGGGITIADANGELDARTSGGAIRLRNLQGKVDARTSGGSIEASFRGQNAGINLHTSGGGIRIAVPKDFKARVEAHTSGGGAHCDLPLLVQGDQNDRHDLRGDLNGGGQLLAASTSGGSIHIGTND